MIKVNFLAQHSSLFIVDALVVVHVARRSPRNGAFSPSTDRREASCSMATQFPERRLIQYDCGTSD